MNGSASPSATSSRTTRLSSGSRPLVTPSSAPSPPYSPDLNPIEQVWRAIKREVSAMFVRGYEHMIATIARAFEQLAEKKAYWEKLVKMFLSPKYASKMLSQ
ncbi:transposase [Methanoculleus taiwanensis]|uniref:transposase n=1 Tax=Methanoculleus taiwanensis TaxID=1550565 RepID=UPI003742BE14